MLMSWHRLPCIRRQLSGGSYKELLGMVFPEKLERVVHVERDYAENDQVVKGKGVVAEVLGHDFKESVAEPDPKSKRWKLSFLRVGAFRKRSVMVEVRKREFGPDEILETKSHPLEPLNSRTSSPSDALFEGIPMHEFMAYVDQRLAQMELEEAESFAEGNHSQEEDLGNGQEEEDVELTVPLPIEFRSVPFGIEAEKGVKSKRPVVKWMSAGKRQQLMPQSRASWMQEWSSMWHSCLDQHRRRSAPSTVRRFYNDPEHSPRPRRALCYLEDTASSRNVKIGRLSHISSILVKFLKSQPAFNGRIEALDGRKNSFWLERKQGKALWRFIGALSDDIRHDRFQFEWEKRRCTEARLYKRTPRRHRQHHTLPPSKTKQLELFGDLPPVQERCSSLIRDSTFRIRTTYGSLPSDEDSDSP